MKLRFGLLLILAASLATAAGHGWGIRRVGNMPDRAPAFEVLSSSGEISARIECIHSGWYDADDLAVRLMGSTDLFVAIVAKGGRLEIEDLGPAKFDCVIADRYSKNPEKNK